MGRRKKIIEEPIIEQSEENSSALDKVFEEPAISNESSNNEDESTYGLSSLQVLSPKEHVQLRRGMYIGDSINPSPLFNEIIDNALDEASSGGSPITEVVVNYDDNTYQITDHGRGFPQGKLHDPNTDKDVEALELLCTTAFSGGKFGGGSYRLVSGLHGVGMLVTNSLCSKFKVTSFRNGKIVRYESENGDTISTTYEDTEEKGSGTTVEFSPSSNYFEDIKIPLNHMLMRCKIASSFGMKNTLKIVEGGVEREIDTSADVYDLLPEDDEGISEYYRHSFTVKDESTGEFATIALKYTSDTKCYYRGYTNLLYNSNGGTHHKILDECLYSAWNKYNISDIKYGDIFLGLRAVIAVFINNTEFSSQSKERLSTPKNYFDKLKELIIQEINKWLDDNNDIRESLIKRFQEYRASQNKLLARKEIRSLLHVSEVKNGSVKRGSYVVRKLIDCSSKSQAGTELMICEGDSAAGSMVQARDVMTQAILPIRGKILNVSKLGNLLDSLKNEEIKSIINSIGAGIGDTSDPSKSAYERIIFFTDADADGYNISVLLAGIFINLLPNLVKNGMVYTALPPLYGWKDKSGYHFTNDQKNITVKEYNRYKGLGEMDPDELWESSMDPATRRLIRINYPDDFNLFNNILSSSSAKFKMLEDLGVIKYE